MRIFKGDCLEVLRGLEPNSVDSVVTDPPAGISFMGKSWDSDKGGRDQWIAWMTDVMRECLRALKPGGHALVWAIPRTSHWTATALENAGFEIRDVVTHLFGSGFPKSMDISKAIDKAAGAEREVVGVNEAFAKRQNKQRKGISWTGQDDGGFSNPETVGQITSPATDAAKRWEGFGTALKPASEHWILCRKPLGEKTVAANVLKHGTGGLNIDASRIAHASEADRASATPQGKVVRNNFKPGEKVEGKETNRPDTSLGRFPANLVLSHNPDCDAECSPGCAVAELDRQSGMLKSGGGTKTTGGRKSSQAGWKEVRREGYQCEPDTGGASRFFYVAKASKRDKGNGNTHPTVKNTKLMEYLIRLVTPPGGTVLDPFMGSGSTGVAALREGFSFVGIEASDEYFSIAENRMTQEKTVSCVK